VTQATSTSGTSVNMKQTPLRNNQKAAHSLHYTNKFVSTFMTQKILNSLKYRLQVFKDGRFPGCCSMKSGSDRRFRGAQHDHHPDDGCSKHHNERSEKFYVACGWNNHRKSS
jgi:hypothetical protein